MAYLHSRPVEAVVHGDLKTSNVLVADDRSLAIADFGLSRVHVSGADNQWHGILCGTVQHFVVCSSGALQW